MKTGAVCNSNICLVFQPSTFNNMNTCSINAIGHVDNAFINKKGAIARYKASNIFGVGIYFCKVMKLCKGIFLCCIAPIQLVVATVDDTANSTITFKKYLPILIILIADLTISTTIDKYANRAMTIDCQSCIFGKYFCLCPIRCTASTFQNNASIGGCF